MLAQVSETERLAIRTVIAYGEQYGYGTLISHLRTAWARRLVKEGLTESSARESAHGSAVMPFEMQDDILDRGEWDASRERYS